MASLYGVLDILLNAILLNASYFIIVGERVSKDVTLERVTFIHKDREWDNTSFNFQHTNDLLPVRMALGNSLEERES